MNRYPYNGGHLMVIPNRHLADFEELIADEQMAISTQTQNAIRILKTVMKPDGFNLGYNLGSAAGAGLKEHLHQHIVPRWNGDTNYARCGRNPRHASISTHALRPVKAVFRRRN